LGKKINFSILYGKTPYGLSQELGISVHDAADYIEGYFAHYPRVSEWINNLILEAKKNGFVKTVWGRRRFIEHINTRNHSLFQEASRIAVNSVIQGTAADIVKLGMIAVDKVITPFNGKLILQIHDEIVVEAPSKNALFIQDAIKAALENVVVDWEVVFKVDIQQGITWWDVS